jgi:hypothetical protein
MRQILKFITWRLCVAQHVLGVLTSIISSSTTAVAASGLPLECGGSSAVGRGRADRPDHDKQHCHRQAPTVKPMAATAVLELLMMGVGTPEICWAVHKRQVKNLRNYWIQLVDLFELYDDERICKS